MAQVFVAKKVVFKGDKFSPAKPFREFNHDIGAKPIDQALNELRAADETNKRRFYITGSRGRFGALRAIEVRKSGRSWWIVREHGFATRAQARAKADEWAVEAGCFTHIIEEEPWI